MSILAFQDQIALYKAGDHTDFRRINLVYCFQDLVNTLTSTDQITGQVIACIESLTHLHLVDPTLFSEISPDLLESTIRLQILLAPKFPKALTQLSISLATYSKAIDFQNELCNIMNLLISNESEHPFEKFRNSQGNDSKDIFKTVITFYIPILIRMFEDSEIRHGIDKLKEFIKFIKVEIQQFHAALGSELMPEIFQVFCERKTVLVKNAAKETLAFLLGMLEIYQSVKMFKAHKNELVETIAEIFGDFHCVLKNCEKFKFESFEFLACLAVKAIKGSVEKMALPYVYSGKFRFKVLIPCGIMNKYAKKRIKIMSYCLYYCEVEIDPWTITSCYSGVSPVSLFMNSLNFINKTPENSLKQGKGFIRKFFMKMETQERIKIVGVLIGKCKTEDKLNFLISILMVSDETGKLSLKYVKNLLQLRPVIDYVITFHSLSKYLTKINAHFLLKNTEIYETIKELYIEIKANLDNNIVKVRQILEEIEKVI